VKKDSSTLNEMLQISKGERKVPVIVEDGKVTVGYEGGA
jgi:glutaredoxin